MNWLGQVRPNNDFGTFFLLVLVTVGSEIRFFSGSVHVGGKEKVMKTRRL